MTSAYRRLFVIPVVAFALLALGTTSPCAALIGLVKGFPYEKRTDTFRRLLFELRFQPLPGFAELHDKPSESLLILLGDPSCLMKVNFPEGLRSFVEQGGAVLIATDKATTGGAGEMLSNLAGVTVAEESLVLRRWPFILQDSGHYLNLYNDSEYCPFVEPLEDSKVLSTMAGFIGINRRPDLFRSNSHPDQQRLQVAVNSPSYLKTSGWFWLRGLHRLAKLPKLCQYERSNPNLPLNSEEIRRSFVDENGPLFGVGGTVGKGRVLVLADHSIFINRMILPRDNGNLEFAINSLHWLRGGVASPMEALSAVNGLRSKADRGNEATRLMGERNKVLFWEDGIIHRKFEVPLRKASLSMPPLIPPEPVIVAAFDQTLAKLEASDSFNRALLQQIDELPGGWPQVVRNTVYLLTLAASLFLAYRFLWRSRHRPELATPSLAKALREHEPRASLLDQRRRALLRLGNVWEMGHRLARECFESAGVAMSSASQPRVRVMRGSRWQRWCERHRVVRLWRLARGDVRAPISPTTLQRLRREIDELKTALADGTIRLT